MQTAGLRSLPLNAFVVGMAALGILCLVAWPIAVIAAISFIGLPIFVLMAAIPTLALAVVTWRLSWLALARLGFRSAVASGILAAVALALPPAVYNAKTEDRVTALVRDDRVEPIPTRTGLAIAIRDGLRSREAACGDLCRRLLLTGAAARVIVDPAGFKPDQAPSAATPAMSFRLANTGSACPEAAVEHAGPTIAIPAEKGYEKSAELMRIAMVEGRCLLREPSRLGEAHLVVSEGSIADGRSPGGAGLNVSADTVRARRLTVHVVESGTLAERYRRTAVSYAPLMPILVPTYAEMSGLELKPAFLRSHETRNTWGKQIAPDWPAFFTQTLGIDLSLVPLMGKSDPAATAKAALARDGALPKATQAIADDLFRTAITQNRMSPQQAEAGLVLLRDERMAVPFTAWAAVRYGKDVRPGYVAEVADVLFARLRKLRQDTTPEVQRTLRDQAQAIGGAIAALPDDEIRRHAEDLVWLAGEPVLRVHAHAALRRLTALGADGIPLMLSLLDVAATQRAVSLKDTEPWQHPYLSGIIALCTMKTQASPALPALTALLERRALPAAGSYGRLGLNTLIALGADPGKAKDTMLAAGIEPTVVDKQLTFALRRIDCSY